MDNNNIQNHIDLSLEIEGLLRTLKERPQDTEAYALLLRKCEQLKQSVSELEQTEAPEMPMLSDSSEASEVSEASEKSEKTEVSEVSDSPEESVFTPAATSPFASEFSINDKYMFIREIFGGSTSEFTEVVSRVEEMQTLGEAYDYFLNDLGWDADDETVSSFLTIVAKHFNSAQ